VTGGAPAGRFVSVAAGAGGRSFAVRAGGALSCWDGAGCFRSAPAGEFVAVAAQGAGWCSLGVEGSLACWRDDGVSVPVWRSVPSAGRFVSVAAGEGHACGLRDGGAVQCWGEDTYGAVDAPEGRFAAISAGGRRTCGLRIDGDISCWGRDDEHLLAAPAEGLRDVAAAAGFTCGLRLHNDWLTCWGRPGADFPDEATMQMRTISAAGDVICGLNALVPYWDSYREVVNKPLCWGPDGAVEASAGPMYAVSTGSDVCTRFVPTGDLDCWPSVGSDTDNGESERRGRRAVGAAGTGVGSGFACGIRTDDEHVVCWAADGAELAAPLGRFGSVAVGAFACGIRAAGTVLCWDRDGSRRSIPRGRFEAVSVGREMACGVRAGGGSVVCWGADGFSPETPSGRFRAVAVGDVHACALRDGNGVAVCWLLAPHRLAPPGVHRPDPEATARPAGRFTAVAAGWDHACALRGDDTMSCWGDDYKGKAGTVEEGYVAMSAGGRHTCGLRADAEVDCWGDEEYWALDKIRWSDDGDQVLSTGPFTAVAAGGWHTCALRVDGTVTCWGLSDAGVPGHPLYIDETFGGVCWARFSDGPFFCFRGAGEDPDGRFSAISAGGVHTCGLRADATVHCWGHGPGGSVRMPLDVRSQVAIDSEPPCCDGWADEDHYATPPDGKRQMSWQRPEENFLCWARWSDKREHHFVCGVYGDVGQADAPAGRFGSVSAGGWHSCGLRDDGSVTCWGDNSHGQSDAPAGRFTSVAAGGIHTCGLRDDASVLCWGVPGPVKPPIGVNWVT
jgi:hypothetical protein